MVLVKKDSWELGYCTFVNKESSLFLYFSVFCFWCKRFGNVSPLFKRESMVQNKYHEKTDIQTG